MNPARRDLLDTNATGRWLYCVAVLIVDASLILEQEERAFV